MARHGNNSSETLYAEGFYEIFGIWFNSYQDKVYGHGGNDKLIGGGRADSLYGGDGNDTLNGGAGNDTLDGGFGFDLIDGGSGIDTVTYSFYSGPIVADLTTNQVSFPGNSTLVDTLRSVENVIGGSGNDKIIGNSADNNLNGGAGYDTAVYAGADTEFNMTILNDGRIQIEDTNPANGDEGTDILSEIEEITFGDGNTYNVVTGDNGNIYLAQKYEVTFSSAGQSTWGSGNSIKTSANWEPFAPIQWNHRFNQNIGLLEFGGGTEGDFHLRTGYEIDSGTIDSTLPFKVLVDAPNRVAVGDTVTITTDYSLLDTASFTTTTPYVSAYLDLGAKLYLGAYVGADLGIFGKPRHHINAIDFDRSIDFEFDTRDGAYSKTFYDFADFTLTPPDIDVRGVQTTDQKLSGSAEDVFLSTEISLDDLIVEKFLKESKNPYLLAMGHAWQNSVDLFGLAGFSWDLLDLDVVGDISLKTSYDLTFDQIDGTLILEDGTTQAFTVGEDVSVDFLTGMDTNGNGQLDFDLKFDLNNPQLNTDVDLVSDLDFDVSALKASGWYDAWILGSGREDFGPLFEKSFDLAKGSIDIYEDTFALGGFNTEFIDDLAIAVV